MQFLSSSSLPHHVDQTLRVAPLDSAALFEAGVQQTLRTHVVLLRDASAEFRQAGRVLCGGVLSTLPPRTHVPRSNPFKRLSLALKRIPQLLSLPPRGVVDVVVGVGASLSSMTWPRSSLTCVPAGCLQSSKPPFSRGVSSSLPLHSLGDTSRFQLMWADSRPHLLSQAPPFRFLSSLEVCQILDQISSPGQRCGVRGVLSGLPGILRSALLYPQSLGWLEAGVGFVPTEPLLAGYPILYGSIREAIRPRDWAACGFDIRLFPYHHPPAGS